MSDKPEVIDAEPAEESTALAPVEHRNSVALMEDLQRQVELSEKTRNMAVKMTRPGDWLAMGKEVYLQAKGAERIAQAAGYVRVIKDGPITEWHDDDDGKYFTVRYTVELYDQYGNLQIQEQGFASSRDKFLGTGKGAKLEQVDRTVIERKALNNGTVRAITRKFGLRGLTTDDLKSFGGKVEIQKVEYKSGKSSSNSSTKSTPAKQSKLEKSDNEVPADTDNEKMDKKTVVETWLQEKERIASEYSPDINVDDIYLPLKKKGECFRVNPASYKNLTDAMLAYMLRQLPKLVADYPPIADIDSDIPEGV